MTTPTVGHVGNVRNVEGAWKEGAWLAVPYPITIHIPGTSVIGNDTFTSKWACPFEEAYVACVSISNDGSGTATGTLSIRNGSTELLDDDGNGTGAVVTTSADLSTAKEYSRANDKIVEYAMTRGDDLTIEFVGDADSTAPGLLVVITLMVPIQALDETDAAENFRYA